MGRALLFTHSAPPRLFHRPRISLWNRLFKAAIVDNPAYIDEEARPCLRLNEFEVL